MKAEGSLRLAARAMSALLRLAGGRVSLPAMLCNASFRFSGIPEFGNRNSEAGGAVTCGLEVKG